MNYEEITSNTNIIINNLNKLSINVNNIKKKVVTINSVYKKLETNRILVNSESNSFLLFQKTILKNEYGYYKNLYDIILDKYSKEILELSEYIIMILISLNKLEIDNIENKSVIMNKIINVKKYKKLTYGCINEIINTTINNLKLVDEFVTLFNKFVEQTINKNSKLNVHNNNFELILLNKKDTILLEYTKYCNRFVSLIDYFKTCSNSIIDQIDSSKLLSFFLSNTNQNQNQNLSNV